MANATVKAGPIAISQTAFIFATVAFAFLFYITVRGDLAKWLGLFGLGGGGSATPAATVATSQPAASSPAGGTQAAGGLQSLAPLQSLSPLGGSVPDVLTGNLK